MATKIIKKTGAEIDLRGIIIHQVIKSAGDKKTTLKMAETPISIGDRERAFISKINKAYFRKSSPNYGVFGAEHPEFKNSLKDYLDGGDFYAFSVAAINHYKAKIENVVAATGGFLIFAHYSNADNGCDYLLVLTINNKDGYSLREKDLTIKDIRNLDLAKLDVACMINITQWASQENSMGDDRKTYLSFIRGNKDISYYFMAFIDCADKTSGRESTGRLTTAIQSYCRDRNYDREKRIRMQNEVFQYCTECLDQKKEIQLGTISAMVDPEAPEQFREFAADEKFSVSAVISGDKTRLKTMKYISYRDREKGLIIEFDSGLYGKDVFYNKEKRELTFRNLPQGFIDQIPI